MPELESWESQRMLSWTDTFLGGCVSEAYKKKVPKYDIMCTASVGTSGQIITLEVTKQSLSLCVHICVRPAWLSYAGDGFSVLHTFTSRRKIQKERKKKICLHPKSLISPRTGARSGLRTLLPPTPSLKMATWQAPEFSLAEPLLPSIAPWQPGSVFQPLPWRDIDQALWRGRAWSQGIYAPQGSLLSSLLLCTATAPLRAHCLWAWPP